MYIDPWQTLEEKERNNLADYGLVILNTSQCVRSWYTYICAFFDHVIYIWNDCVRVEVDSRLWNGLWLCV